MSLKSLSIKFNLATLGCALSLLLSNTNSAAQPSDPDAIAKELSSSPDDVTQLLSTLKEENTSLIPQTPFNPFFKKYKQKTKLLKEKYGINFGMSYIPLLEYSALGTPRPNASGGAYQFFGHYKPKLGERFNTTLGLKLEDNHTYSTIAPGNFNQALNSYLKTVSGYRHSPLTITDLWLQQSLIPNWLAYRIGKIELTSMMNSYAFDSRQFYFLSDAFSGHPATTVPGRALGGVLGMALGPHLYSALGIVDKNGTPTTTSFSGKFFTAIELGYRDQITTPQSDNYHIFLWHSEAQPEKQQLADQGLSLVLQKNIANKFIPFIKMDWSRGTVATFKKLFISGFGLQYPFKGNIGLWGLGMGYAELADNTPQAIVETYYRLQLTPHSQLTPNIQFIKTLPNINGHQNIASVYNLRYRIAI